MWKKLIQQTDKKNKSVWSGEHLSEGNLPTVLASSSTSSTVRCLYSTLKLSMRDWRSTMCLEDRLLGQKAAAAAAAAPTVASEEEEEEDDGGEEADAAEKGGGTSPAAAASAASDWLGGPYMPPWLTSLEKLLYGDEEEANGKMQ